MTREIKFRIIWKGKTYYWGYIPGGFAGLPSTNDGLYLEKAKELSCQYTGLKDKQGKEIYEGDILAPLPNDYNPEYKGNWTMTFDRGTFLAVSIDDRHETWAPYWTEQQFEIIGNIYETPELLQKG